MGATTTTGTGKGNSRKLTVKELSMLANGPTILVAGRSESEGGGAISSPPIPSSRVIFPNPLPGSPDNYVVIMTSINAGNAYVADMTEDINGDFSGFYYVSDTEGTVMYIVTKVGQKPSV